MIMLNKQNINKFLCSKFLCSKFSPSAASSYLGFNAPEFIRFYSTSFPLRGSQIFRGFHTTYVNDNKHPLSLVDGTYSFTRDVRLDSNIK